MFGRRKIRGEYMNVRKKCRLNHFLEPSVDCCPICGEIVGVMQGFNPSPDYFRHRCKESFLKAVNSARTREEESPSLRDLPQMGYGDILREGFKLNQMSQSRNAY